jgi:hypothetical protein
MKSNTPHPLPGAGGERDRTCVGRNMIAVKSVCLALPNVTMSPLPPHPPHTASVGRKRGGGVGEGGKGKITENGRQTYKKKEIRSCIVQTFKFVTSGSDNVQWAYNGKNKTDFDNYCL